MPRGIPVADETRAEIVEMYHGGLEIPQISQESGVSVPTIYRILSEAGLTGKDALPRTLNALSPETLDGILRAYRDTNETVVSIVTRFRITHTELYSLLREAGISVRASTNVNSRAGAVDEAIALYTSEEEYVPLWEIERRTGVTAQRLNRYLHRLNIPLRRPRAFMIGSVPKEIEDV